MTKEVEKVSKYVKEAEAEINELRISPRLPFKYPFDVVALPTVSKAFALSNACLKLISSEFFDEAYGLSRSIVECATNLRYMTADSTLQDQRTRDFVNYALAYKAFWAHYALEQFLGREEESEIREYAKHHGIVPDTKPARRHWSGLSGFI